MGKEQSTLDMESLKDRDRLTPDEEAQIENDASWGNKEPEKETPWDKKEPEEKPEEGEKPEEKEPEKEPEKTQEKPDEEKTDDEKQAEAKAEEEAKAAEDAKKAEEEKASKEKAKGELIEKTAKALSEEKGISLEEAKSTVESEYEYSEKYGHDSLKLARTAKSIQALYSKTEARIKDLESKRMPGNVIQIEDQSLIVPGKDGRSVVWTFDKIVEKFREGSPDIAEIKTDQECYDLVLTNIKTMEANKNKEMREKVDVDSKIKRSDLISRITGEDKRFLPEIEKFLDGVSPHEIVRDTFDIKDVIIYQKGLRYDADIKKTIEETTKRVTENAKILGERNTATPPARKASTKKVLSDEDKRRAEDMYDGSGMTKDQMYESYAEQMEQDKKW